MWKGIWKDSTKGLLIETIVILLFIFAIYYFINSVANTYKKEIHQKGGLKPMFEKIWEGEKK